MPDVRYNSSYWPDVVKCEHCGHTSRPVHKHTFPHDPDTVYCPLCGEEVPLITVKQSNGDKIRAMSDEELAMWVLTVLWCCAGQNAPLSVTAGYDEWIDWFKGPAGPEASEARP